MKKLLVTLLSFSYVIPAMANFRGYNGEWGHHMGFLGGFGMILPTLLIVGLVYAVYRGGRRRGGHQASKTSAHTIINERLAKGEIDVETFHELKKTIEKSK